MFACLTFVILAVPGCSPDSVMLAPQVETTGSSALVDAVQVVDLHAASFTESSVTLTWTEVDDGTGDPAWYRLRYAEPPMQWPEADLGCDGNIKGVRIGDPMSCTVDGLASGTQYEFQVMSYRTGGGRWRGAVYSNVATGATQAASEPAADSAAAVPSGVSDLAVVDAAETTLTVRWTQVDDGTGGPAWYRVKYAAPSIDWSSASVGCDRTLETTAIGEPISCTIEGLAAASGYEVQLMSYRVVDGRWEDALYSNVAAGQTLSAASQEVAGGVWISPAEIQSLPTSGAAWENVLDEANGACGLVDLSDQTQLTNTCVLAKGLVFARTGGETYRTAVEDAIGQIVAAPTYDGTALSLGRELGAYVIAADLVGLPTHDPVLDRAFRQALEALRTTYTWGAASNLIDCHEKRPNNWGNMCGATRAAIAVYLGDADDLERTAQVFKGYLGDRSSYAGFVFGDDLSWQCDPNRPVGINPAGCTRYGVSLDGVLPDDQRRGGSFTWPAFRENYVWEGLQGALMEAVILDRAGYPAFEWEDRALLRAAQWLHNENGYPAQGDDTWQPHILNQYYGTSFPAPVPSRAGKNMGWTDWTHG